MLQLIIGVLFGTILGYITRQITEDDLSAKLLEFIDKNINERVIYSNPEAPYSNEKYPSDKEDKEDKEELMPSEMTADDLRNQMEGFNNKI